MNERTAEEWRRRTEAGSQMMDEARADDAEIGVLLTDNEPADLAREVQRLRRDCAEAYQAVGFLADCLGYWEMAADDPRQAQITKLLDNLSGASDGEPRPHDDLLPFGWPVDGGAST